MLTTRVIARLDVKGMNVVKGRQFDGLRVIGGLYDMAQRAQAQGADELLYIDIVASLYGRLLNAEAVEEVSRDLFIPLTVAGGIRSLDDVRVALRVGADKVAINTAGMDDPLLYERIAERYGKQAVVVSIEAKRDALGSWQAMTLGGREPSNWTVPAWANAAVFMGAGEVLLTSVDCDGMQQGCDTALIAAVRTQVPDAPLVVSGGVGSPAHAWEALKAGADAVAIASNLHREGGLGAVKYYLHGKGVEVRV